MAHSPRRAESQEGGARRGGEGGGRAIFARCHCPGVLELPASEASKRAHVPVVDRVARKSQRSQRHGQQRHGQQRHGLLHMAANSATWLQAGGSPKSTTPARAAFEVSKCVSTCVKQKGITRCA